MIKRIESYLACFDMNTATYKKHTRIVRYYFLGVLVYKSVSYLASTDTFNTQLASEIS